MPKGAVGYDISLQADRLGTGAGCVYNLTATATDLAGNVASTCVVPYDLGNYSSMRVVLCTVSHHTTRWRRES